MNVHLEQFRLNELFGPNAERFTDVWTLTYFHMAICSLLAVHRSLEANFKQYFCWVVNFMFQRVVFASLSRASAFKCGASLA